MVCLAETVSLLLRYQVFLKHSIPDFWRHPLWQRRHWSPFLRFAKLQAAFALGRRELCLPWMEGLQLPVQKGDSGLTGNFYLGLQEFKDMAFALHLLQQDDLFVDVGANLGSYSLLAAGSAGARSLAFEPVPATYERLLSVVAINNLSPRVSVRNLALASAGQVATGERLAFSADRDCFNSFVGESYKGEKIYVDVDTLDSQCLNLNPVLIKIDVEGFESDVLAGAAETLSRPSLLAVIIEGQTEAVNQVFQERGFVDCDYDPLQRQVKPLQRYAPNRIWIQEAKRAEVESRLKAARMRTIYGSSF